MTTVKTVQSLIRAGNLLKQISKGENRLSELSESLKLSKGTIYRLLYTLKELGFVFQDPVSLKYYLGPSILNFVTNPSICHNALISSAYEQMNYLREFTRETVLLHIKSGSQRICIQEVESPENIRYTNGIGFVAPLYVGAAGKLLLASLEEDEIASLLNSITLAAMTPRTITSRRKLLQEVSRVKKQGYATSFGERIAGAACLSVPITNYPVPVALSILGPEYRLSRQRIEDLIEVALKSARTISANLDFHGGA
ncbi:MAG: IclR family transcriptional regulator [Thermodesulfobacteriota bacterium]